MSDEDKSSKSEQPTDKRMDQAKNKGQVPRSQEINSWAMLFGMVMALIYIFPWTMNEIALLNLQFFQTPHTMPMDNDHIRFLFMDVGKSLGLILTPIFALFVVLGLTVSVLQTGWTFSFEKLELKLNALSPLTGVKKLVGTSAMVEFVKGLIKFIVVGTLVFAAALPLLADVELLPGFELMDILDRIRDIALLIVSLTLVIMTVVAALDFVYQKWKTKDDLKMSKNEVKDENKQSEGDPKVKARIAQIRMERAQQRIVAATIRADVVITNPTHFAVALKYDMDTMAAPRLVGKGMDELAKRMREAADEHDVPIVENPPLARAIYASVEIDQDIPPEQYQAVAEVISYVYRLKGRLPHDGTPLRPPAPFDELDPGDDTLAAASDW
ncbi:MAG: flagellar biosynthesis protein FlhB [Rhodospirillales bacterium]|jgi:flagellar biosynthetic protein FlhB|nr:flagellar biosynthesis protein FlhB [Acidiferrobacteraceae bacterium]MDP6427428.1 flagellar biosynthesis protein FlhB [Rhodospirillales bacterium]MDP6645115.1 flagellar biosynthesis protein FlhB [Rhodospirillales bacterium]MDP6841931.1 flagellar biosynthesis protein FlhB [Rhodospirillales bacterium]|tara:strand:+ start:562 stop:1713 length:1152 start_codon:yes stop_codon:yes gene_type:complete